VDIAGTIEKSQGFTWRFYLITTEPGFGDREYDLEGCRTYFSAKWNVQVGERIRGVSPVHE
jgi:hypothetical protein